MSAATGIRANCAMNYTRLGRTGLKVSRLCLGTMNFGTQADEVGSYAVMDRALEHGINFIDTANVYGWKIGQGVTEKIVGGWLAQGGRREHVVIATKVYGKMGDGPNDRGLSAYHIMGACEGSLRRLGVDHIDLYQMHHVDRTAPWDEVWQAMEILVRQGKVLYVGSSNFAAWQIARAQASAAERHFLGLVSEQSRYNLTARTIELEVVPACEAYGLALIPYSPLGGGFLAGSPGAAVSGRRTSESLQARMAEKREQLDAWEALCRDVGEPPADLALAWLLANPVVTAPIIGPRTVEQLDGCVKAIDLQLTDDVMTRIDEIWPGPGGAAPEAYAW